MAAILTVDNINVYYGSIHAIKGISFEVNEGEIVTLIGANGAGKSTTLNTIAGLLHSHTGSVTFLGEGSCAQNCLPGPGTRAGGTPRLLADDSAGKSGNGLLYAARLWYFRRSGAGL